MLVLLGLFSFNSWTYKFKKSYWRSWKTLRQP